MEIEKREVVPGPWGTLLSVGSFAGWSDGELLSRFAEGRDEVGECAFATLVERHGASVWRVCRAVLGDDHEAEDAFQATFLVLARRTRWIRNREAVGAWLIGTAYRVAGNARSSAIRRKSHERRAAGQRATATNAPDPADWVPVLLEEVGRLPEKFRLPILLCYLDGMTQEEAGHRLGWPIGTVRSRLARGRDRLRNRLILRGLAPSVAASALAWREAGAAVLPRGLAGRTIAIAAGSGSVGAIAGPVAILAREGLAMGIRETFRTHALAWVAAGAIAAGAVGQAGVLHVRGQAEDQKAPARPSRGDPPAKKAEPIRFWVLTLDRPKLSDTGLTEEDVVRSVASLFPAGDRAIHPKVWADPSREGQYLVLATTPDGRPMPIDALRELRLSRPDAQRVGIPLRNVATFSRANRSKKDLEAELDRARAQLVRTTEERMQRQAELEKVLAELTRAEEQERKAESALLGARQRLEFGRASSRLSPSDEGARPAPR